MTLTTSGVSRITSIETRDSGLIKGAEHRNPMRNLLRCSAPLTDSPYPISTDVSRLVPLTRSVWTITAVPFCRPKLSISGVKGRVPKSSAPNPGTWNPGALYSA